MRIDTLKEMPMRQANAGDAEACRRAERIATRKRQRFGRTAIAPE
jgi:2-oxoglutarate dehydrogenase complex dehydrogenase (E1) component-like enzyme